MIHGGGKFPHHSWIRILNVVFLGQPIGVGFPYAHFGRQLQVSTPSRCRKPLPRCRYPGSPLITPLKHFRNLRKNKVHPTGASYVVSQLSISSLPLSHELAPG